MRKRKNKDPRPWILTFGRQTERLSFKTAMWFLLWFAIAGVVYFQPSDVTVYRFALGLLFIYQSVLALNAGLRWKCRRISGSERVALATLPIWLAACFYISELRKYHVYHKIHSLHWYLSFILFMSISTYPAFFVGRILADRGNDRYFPPSE